MTIAVFSGPTLAASEVQAILPRALCFGPAARGQILQASALGVRAICLIDGLFDQRPAVMHKECLWALQQDIAVFGAASMGALRAAELAPFGMVGWGAVFQLFVTGALEDDDEVAVAHAGAEHGYKASSMALVNLRATLAHAERNAAISASDRAALIEQLKRNFYSERSDERLRGHAQAILSAEAHGRLERWLARPDAWIDQKQADARDLLHHVRACEERGELRAPPRSWTFPHTASWHALLVATRAAPPLVPSAHESEPAPACDPRLLLEEIQLLGPEALAEIMLASSFRAHALSLAADPAVPAAPAGEGAAAEARVQTLALEVRGRALAQLAAVLQLRGDLAAVSTRARHKLALDAASNTAEKMPAAEAIAWYFEKRLRRAPPADLAAYARRIGMGSAHELCDAIARELAYLSGRRLAPA